VFGRAVFFWRAGRADRGIVLLLQPHIEAEFPALSGGWVGEVEFEVAKFRNGGFEADWDFLAWLVAVRRWDFDFECRRFLEFVCIREDLSREVTCPDFGLEKPKFRRLASVEEKFLPRDFMVGALFHALGGDAERIDRRAATRNSHGGRFHADVIGACGSRLDA